VIATRLRAAGEAELRRTTDKLFITTDLCGNDAVRTHSQ
jgi:hypothetical protein